MFRGLLDSRKASLLEATDYMPIWDKNITMAHVNLGAGPEIPIKS